MKLLPEASLLYLLLRLFFFYVQKTVEKHVFFQEHVFFDVTWEEFSKNDYTLFFEFKHFKEAKGATMRDRALVQISEVYVQPYIHICCTLM